MQAPVADEMTTFHLVFFHYSQNTTVYIKLRLLHAPFICYTLVFSATAFYLDSCSRVFFIFSSAGGKEFI